MTINLPPPPSLSSDGVIVELKSTPKICSIIIKDGTLCDISSVVGREDDGGSSGNYTWTQGQKVDGSGWYMPTWLP